MTSGAVALVHETDTLVSGLSTTSLLEPVEGPKALVVAWIAWFSRFRGSGLRIGDRITHVGGEALDPLLLPGKMHELIGQASESLGWQKRGSKAGDPLNLTIWRPDGGLEVKGALSREQLFRDLQGKVALAPGGPSTLEKDGFPYEWGTWYEKLVWKITQILEGSWETAKLDTRKELAELLAHGPRIEALLKTYPGEFADRTQEDWTQAAESLRGKKFEDVDLSYREMGAQRLELAKKAATAAWEAVKKEAADRMIAAFPAPDIEARAVLAGKWVELPWITPSGIVNDLGQAWAIAPGSSGGGYVARMTASPEFERFFRALYRFGTLVQPGTAERYQFIGELLPTPAMITYRDRPLTAHQVLLVAGRAGEAGECVVGLRNDAPAFAGESEMAPIGAEDLKDNASPAEVLEFMVAAIKRADERSWRRCFAMWRAGVYDTGRPHFLPLYVPSSGEWHTAWEAARRLISKNVYDVRVDRVGKVRRLFDADRETGAPTVDQVIAYLDFIGHFDGEYRSF